ncbi:MAG: hypothetical protein F6K17_11400 [Okeania sp. SIO3C4]|nr:hypothetical protein [Okeania sp. SIO3C4]
MNKIKFIIISFFLSNCSSNDNQIKVSNEIKHFDKFPIEKKMKVEDVIEYDKDAVLRMHIQDSILVLHKRNKKDGFYFENINLKTKKAVHEYIRKGRGANESLGGFNSGFINDYLWMFDLTGGNINFIKKKEAFSSKVPSIVKHKIQNSVYSLVVLDTVNYITVGDDTSRFKIQKRDIKTGKVLKEYGTFENVDSQVPVNALQSAFESPAFLKPDGSKLVTSFRFTDVIEIYDLKNEFRSKTIQGPINFDVDFTLKKYGSRNIFLMNSKTRMAFHGGSTVTNRFIYLCFSGNTSEEDKNLSTKQIFVYDWNGNPVKRLYSDFNIYGIAVRNDETLYAYDADNGRIVEINIE